MQRRAFISTAVGAVTLLGIGLYLRRPRAAAPSNAATALQARWQESLKPGADVAPDASVLQRTHEEWQKLVPAESYQVLFEEETEAPLSSPLNLEKRAGVFVCRACRLPLFTAEMKFDSGTGWPSFFTSIPGHCASKQDFKIGIPRTEYHCVKCGGHQGHLFDDGPAPTGERWCNNGVALAFIPLES